MTHRDEWLALQARLEAQAREIEDARAEIEFWRAAHAHKAREIERLRRQLEALHRPGATGAPAAAWSSCVAGPSGSRVIGSRVLCALGTVGTLAAAAVACLAAVVALRGSRPLPSVARAHVPPPSVLEHLGHVLSGGGLLPAGEACRVRVEPADAAPYDCRVEVRCGGLAIYGATADTGYVRCAGRDVVRDAQFTARDGDPAMQLDLASRRLVVEERLGLGTQRVEIALDTIAR